MVRLEELPEDGEKGTSFSAPTQTGATTEDAFVDDIYDRAVAQGGFTDKSFEEALSDLSKAPLFMTSLEDAGSMRS